MFRNTNQRKFLFALDKDKQPSVSPLGANTIPSPKPLVSNPVQHLTQPSNIGQKLPGAGKIMKPTNIPSLPTLSKMPKFGRVKQYFKKQ